MLLRGQTARRHAGPTAWLTALLVAQLSSGCATSIWTASARGDLARVESLIDEDPRQANLQDRISLTPLHHAARAGEIEVVRLLLSRGAHPDLPALGGMTPLYIAAAGSHDHVIRELASAGANLNAKSPWNPLRIAAAGGNLTTVDTLLTLGANPEGHRLPPLHAASARGYLDIMTRLEKGGARLDRVTLEGFESALTVAAAQGALPSVRWLLSRGVNIHHDTQSGRTALHIAAENGHLELVRLLLDGGARVDTASLDRDTPLAAAKRAGHSEVVNILEAAGAR